MIPVKVYLGDGVYVELESIGLVLTTENGIAVTNRIVLESEVYNNLVSYVQGIQHRGEAADDE